jgi:hypothetical protein
MGFMDKAKEAALQAKTQAQQLAQQGQAKVQTIQQGRSEHELQRTLGEAVYNAERRGGDREAVVAAMTALDQHYAAAAAAPADAGTAPAAGAAPTTPPATPPAAPAAGAAPAAPASGSFTLDNM